ncbi:MAG: hypothetical protein KC652_23540, partial [Cyanobacteria bacterium HKST-UBA01]|nr:hypothetical protein [Cyanobacteria bacterium HKST-UBA01]
TVTPVLKSFVDIMEFWVLKVFSQKADSSVVKRGLSASNCRDSITCIKERIECLQELELDISLYSDGTQLPGGAKARYNHPFLKEPDRNP